MIMLCKFKNATCLPACLAGSFTHQEHKWFKTQMLSKLRCRSTLQWSNYCLGGSYYPHHDMNSTQSKHASIVMYFPNWSIVKKSFERSFSSLNVNFSNLSPFEETNDACYFPDVLCSIPPPQLHWFMENRASRSFIAIWNQAHANCPME